VPANRTYWIAQVFCALLLVYIVYWNVCDIRGEPLSPRLEMIGAIFRIDQSWSGVPPYVVKDDGWFVIPGRLRNGKEVDVFRNGRSVSFEKPSLVSDVCRV
jgi:hypothetical protein